MAVIRLSIIIFLCCGLILTSWSAAATEFKTKTFKVQMFNGLWADVHINGYKRQYATVEFRSRFKHLGAVALSPSVPVLTGKRFREGKRSLFIEEIQLTPPTDETKGYLTIDCRYTNENGKNLKEVDGELAIWRAPKGAFDAQ